MKTNHHHPALARLHGGIGSHVFGPKLEPMRWKYDPELTKLFWRTRDLNLSHMGPFHSATWAIFELGGEL